MANYTVNAYNNGGTGGSVNMRSGAGTSYGIIVQVPHGDTVSGAKSGDWSYMSYSSYSGYMMTVFLDDQGGDTSDGGTYLGTGQVIGGGSLFCRKQPIAGYEYWGQFQEGTTVQIYSCTASGWYETRWNGSIGYVMSQFIQMGSGTPYGSWVTRWIAPSTGQTVNIRQDASTNYAPIAVWSHGKKVEVNDPNSTWSQVREYGSTTTMGWVMTQFLSASDPGGGSSGGTYYSSNSRLSEAEMRVNAQYILNYLRNRGWTKNAICGMLGNMQVESYINPGVWQSFNFGNKNGGFGLVQWTPSTKYTNWAASQGYAIGNMDGQLQRLIYEISPNSADVQWLKTTAYPMTFAQFIVSTNSAYSLACAFLRNYERPASLNEATRGINATNWFNLLS